MLWTQAFWQGAAERAIKTLAQTLVAFFAVGVPIFAIDWREALAVTAAAGVASVLTSIGNADFTAGVTVPHSVPPPLASAGAAGVYDVASTSAPADVRTGDIESASIVIQPE